MSITKYEPASYEDRQALARALEQMFQESKFVKVPGAHGEDVYEFEVTQVPGVKIVVYSSISNGAVRDLGADAIRVYVKYRRKDGKDQFLLSEARVFRTGSIAAIAQRTKERMRDAYSMFRDRCRDGKFCKTCGAPSFKSKNGNEVCANTCWVK